MTASTSKPGEPAPFAQQPDFWVLIGYALVLGVVGAVFGLLFMGFIAFGDGWYEDSSSGWMDGHWWWVAVTGASGVVVGLLRRITRLPDKTSGLIVDLEAEAVDPNVVSGIVVVSAASLIGGASLGPEQALGTFGGGVGGWLADRQARNHEDRQVATLAGFAGAYGGVFSSSVIPVMMILEVARPGGAKFSKVLLTTVLSSTLSLGIYFAVAGSVFLDVYPVPAYEFHSWQLLLGIPFGLLAAVVVALLGVITQGAGKLFDRLNVPTLVKATIGGLIFGVIGVALPLTMFTGSDQLGVILKDGSTLSVGFILLVVVAKMITFGVSLASGFVGGPIFPTLFIGGSVGVALHQVIPDLPLGLTFTCMLAAVMGGAVSAPFTTVLLAGFMTQVGALNVAPAMIAVVTSFLVVEAIKYKMTARQAAG